jgi:small-conductance mechanosensitive channel
MNSFWDYEFYHNSIGEWIIALAIILGSMLALRLLKGFGLNRLRKFSQRTTSTFDDLVVKLIEKSVMPLLYILAFYVGLQYISLPDKAAKVVEIAVMLCATFFVLRMITSSISYLFTSAMAGKDENAKREKQARGILLIVNIVVWLLGLLFVVDNLGYDITTIVAGLGIGGIAIALAAQTILGDLFSYLVIFFDKPFEIGDFIIVEDKMGSVEYIGIKTTRVRTLGGEQLVFSNTDLTNSRVHNYKRMEQRRIVFSFGVTYNTNAAVLRKIPGMAKAIVEESENIRFDRAHFKSFGSSSLDFEVVYYVLSADFNNYMDVQQTINFKLFERFESEGIEFAFPTQTVYLYKANASKEQNAELFPQ